MIAFTQVCRKQCADDWAKALGHPFVAGVAGGNLDPAQVKVYLAQDRHYLRAYAATCRALVARASRVEDRELFTVSARLSEEAEADMQRTLCAALGLALEPEEVRPATRAYIDHENRCMQNPSRVVALAAAAPCNLLYAEIGSNLKQHPAAREPEHPYRAWLDLYADPTVQACANAWAECLDRWAETAPYAEREEAADAFALSVQHEERFWEQAWQAAPSKTKKKAGLFTQPSEDNMR